MGRFQLQNSRAVLSIKILLVGFFSPILVGFIEGFIAEIFKLDSFFLKSLLWGITSYLLLHIFIVEPVRFYKTTQRFIQIILGFFNPVFKAAYYIIPFWIIIIIAGFLILVELFKFEEIKFIFFFLIRFYILYAYSYGG